MHRARYDVDRMIHDAARKGWLPIDLIRRVKGVTPGFCYKFLRGETNSPRVAAKLAKALGKASDEYLIENEPERVA